MANDPKLLSTNRADLFFENSAVGRLKKEIWDRIGIATHGYADTWAHQNFVGYDHAFNGMAGVVEGLIPDIGHADAGHVPDIPHRIWTDKRLVEANRTIDNKVRFLEAAKHIFIKYSKHVNIKAKAGDIEKAWFALRPRLSRAIGTEATSRNAGSGKRISMYMAIESSIRGYRKSRWFKQAVQPLGFGKARWKCDDYVESDWYRFQEAVKEHQAFAVEMLTPLFHQIGFTDIKNY